jgi:hypothetical protein
MNNYCTDIGYTSINHYGEELCGDHIEVVEVNENSTIVVLADGLGSGVKACILATLTSKILSTMLAAGLSIQDCMETIALTLPVCSVRKVAYSTFSIIHILNNEEAEIIQYDNPTVIFLRKSKNVDYPKKELNIDNKKIFYSKIRLIEDDTFIVMSDGCPHAGIGNTYNFGWKLEDIIEFMEPMSTLGYTSKTLSTILTEEVNKLYARKPGDDASVCVVKVRKREPMNILFGPPNDVNEGKTMMSLFFAKAGKHIVCGGTTSSIAANYLGKTLTHSLEFIEPEIPPISYIDGVDLVTEGVITINKVLQNAKNLLDNNEDYAVWGYKNDGASLISRLLFEEATDINFYVGRAINPAHQNPNLPITFSIKMNLVKELSECLKKLGKRVKVNYF